MFVAKNVNFFIVKVLVKSNKGGCEVTLIYFMYICICDALFSRIQLLFVCLMDKNNQSYGEFE